MKYQRSMRGFPEQRAEIWSAQLRDGLTACLPCMKRIICTSDALNAFYGELGGRDGVALIAGTGSSAFCVQQGQVRQVGGWGYLIDDVGSGFWIGSAVLRAAFRAMDERGLKRRCGSWCRKSWNCPCRRNRPNLYRRKRYVASFAPLAFAAVEAEDLLHGRLWRQLPQSWRYF